MGKEVIVNFSGMMKLDRHTKFCHVETKEEISADQFADLSEEERSSYVLQDFGTAMRQADECDVLANQIYVIE